VGDPTVIQDIPESTHQDVVAANITLAEAENDSAPDMPAKKVPQVVCMKLQLIPNLRSLGSSSFKAVY
jgi:hypothetical protein